MARDALVRDLLEAVVENDRVVAWRVYCRPCGHTSTSFANQPRAVAAAREHSLSNRHRRRRPRPAPRP